METVEKLKFLLLHFPDNIIPYELSSHKMSVRQLFPQRSQSAKLNKKKRNSISRESLDLSFEISNSLSVSPTKIHNRSEPASKHQKKSFSLSNEEHLNGENLNGDQFDISNNPKFHNVDYTSPDSIKNSFVNKKISEELDLSISPNKEFENNVNKVSKYNSKKKQQVRSQSSLSESHLTNKNTNEYKNYFRPLSAAASRDKHSQKLVPDLSISLQEDNVITTPSKSIFSIKQQQPILNIENFVDRPSSSLFEPFHTSPSVSPTKWYGSKQEIILSSKNWLTSRIENLNSIADEYVHSSIDTYQNEVQKTNNALSNDNESTISQSLDNDIVKEKASLLLLKYLTCLNPIENKENEIEEKWQKFISDFSGQNSLHPRMIAQPKSRMSAIPSPEPFIENKRPQTAPTSLNKQLSNLQGSPSNKNPLLDKYPYQNQSDFYNNDREFDSLSTVMNLNAGKINKRPKTAHLQGIFGIHTGPSRDTTLLSISPAYNLSENNPHNFSPRISELMKKYRASSNQTPQDVTIQRRSIQHEALVTRMRNLRRKNAKLIKK